MTDLLNLVEIENEWKYRYRKSIQFLLLVIGNGISSDASSVVNGVSVGIRMEAIYKLLDIWMERNMNS